MSTAPDIWIQVDARQLAEVQEVLTAFPKRANAIVSSALNRGIDLAFKESRTVLAADLGMRPSDLTKKHRFGAIGRQSTGVPMRKELSTAASLSAMIRFSGKRIPLSFFKAKQRQAQRIVRSQKTGKILVRASLKKTGRSAGVDYSIAGGGQRYLYPGFMRMLRSGHVGVLVRKATAARTGRRHGLPVYEPKGPSIIHVARSKALTRALHERMMARIVERVRSGTRRIWERQPDETTNEGASE